MNYNINPSKVKELNKLQNSRHNIKKHHCNAMVYFI